MARVAKRGFGTYSGDGMTVMVEGLPELQAKLEKMLRDTEDLRGVWPFYHEAFMAAENDWFASSGGGTWAPLKRRYARWKGHNRILRLTNRLLFSLITQGNAHIFDTNPRWMRTGSRDPVANIHFSKKRKKRRPMDVNSEAMQSHMREAVLKHAERYAQTWEGHLA